MKVRFSTVATRGFLFLPTRRFDLALRVANFQMKKDNIKRKPLGPGYVLGIPSGDTQNTRDLGTGVPKTRGYPNHCDTDNRRGEGIGNVPDVAWGRGR